MDNELSESEVLEAFEMIDLDIETSGPSDQLCDVAYRWDQVLLLLGSIAAKPPPAWLTRRQASETTEYLTGLTYLYGPKELTSFLIQDRATGKLQFGALIFISKQGMFRFLTFA